MAASQRVIAYHAARHKVRSYELLGSGPIAELTNVPGSHCLGASNSLPTLVIRNELDALC